MQSTVVRAFGSRILVGRTVDHARRRARAAQREDGNILLGKGRTFCIQKAANPNGRIESVIDVEASALQVMRAFEQNISQRGRALFRGAGDVPARAVPPLRVGLGVGLRL